MINEENLQLIKNNTVFKRCYYLSKISIISLERELPNLGNFADSNVKDISSIEVSCKNEAKKLFKIFENQTQNQIKNILVIKSQKKSSKTKIYIPSQKYLLEIGLKNNIHLEFIENINPFRGEHFLHTFILAIYNEIDSLSDKLKSKLVDELIKTICFNISKDSLFEKYNYKGILSKSSFQNVFLEEGCNNNIPFRKLSIILSDYYNINIVIVVENVLLYSPHHNKDRLSLILLYSGKKFIILHNNNLNTSLFNNSFLEDVEEHFYEKTKLTPISKIEAISKYKVSDIHLLSEALGIFKNNNMENEEGVFTQKKKNKVELYNEILEYFP